MTCCSTPTWGAARPSPLAVCMVSTMSSIKTCKASPKSLTFFDFSRSMGLSAKIISRTATQPPYSKELSRKVLGAPSSGRLLQFHFASDAAASLTGDGGWERFQRLSERSQNSVYDVYYIHRVPDVKRSFNFRILILSRSNFARLGSLRQAQDKRQIQAKGGEGNRRLHAIPLEHFWIY